MLHLLGRNLAYLEVREVAYFKLYKMSHLHLGIHAERVLEQSRAESNQFLLDFQIELPSLVRREESLEKGPILYENPVQHRLRLGYDLDAGMQIWHSYCLHES